MRCITVTALCLVLGASWSMLAHANLVTNGGFETGDFTGWTVTGDGILIDGVFQNTGSFDASFGAPSTIPNPGILSQSIATAPGQYLLTFALQDEAGVSSDLFFVTFEGATVASITGDQAPGSYATWSLTVAALSINPALSFQGLNDNAAWNLDDVSLTPVVTAIPEPPSVLLFASALMLSLGMVNLGHRRFRR